MMLRWPYGQPFHGMQKVRMRTVSEGCMLATDYERCQVLTLARMRRTCHANVKNTEDPLV